MPNGDFQACGKLLQKVYLPAFVPDNNVLGWPDLLFQKIEAGYQLLR
jgi:hypothetical protein